MMKFVYYLFSRQLKLLLGNVVLTNGVVIQVELEQLKLKFEKIEKERNEYKHATDKLETKVSCVLYRDEIFPLIGGFPLFWRLF